MNRQSSRFYALMNNYDRTLELVAEGNSSAGSASKQFQLYNDSLEASLNRLTTQIEKFYNSLTNGNGIIKVTVDLLTGLLKIVNSLASVSLAIPALGVYGAYKGAKSLINNYKTFSGLAKDEDYNRYIEDKKHSEKQRLIAGKLKEGKPLTFKDVFGKSEQETKTTLNNIEKKKSPEVEAVKEVGNDVKKITNIMEGKTGESENLENNNESNNVKESQIDNINEQNQEKSFWEKFKDGSVWKGKEEGASDWKILRESFGKGASSAKTNFLDTFKSLASGGRVKGTAKGILQGSLSAVKGFGSELAGGIEKTGLGQQGLKFLGKTFSGVKLANIGGMLGKLIGTGGPFVQLTIAIKGAKAIAEKINKSLGITAKAAAAKADTAAEKASSLTELQSEYSELATKTIRTTEEEKELSSIITKITAIDYKLGQQMSATDGQISVDLLENAIKLSNKEEAKWRKNSNNKEATGFFKNQLNAISNLWGATKALMGLDIEEYQQEHSDSISKMRNNASYLATQYDLNASQMKVVNSYLNNFLSTKGDYYDYESAVKDVTDKMEKLAKGLTTLTYAEQERLSSFTDKANSGDYSYNELAAIVSEENEKTVKEAEDSILADYKATLESISKNGIDIEQLKNYNEKALDGFNNLDTSGLTTNEKLLVSNDEKYMINNDDIMSNLSSMEGQARKDYIIKLAKLGEISSLTAEKMTGLADSSIKNLSEAFTKAATAVENYQSVLKGNSQAELLEKMASKEISLSDVTISSDGLIYISGTSDYINSLKESVNTVRNAIDVATLNQQEQKEKTYESLNESLNPDYAKRKQNLLDEAIGENGTIKSIALGALAGVTTLITTSVTAGLAIGIATAITANAYDKWKQNKAGEDLQKLYNDNKNEKLREHINNGTEIDFGNSTETTVDQTSELYEITKNLELTDEARLTLGKNLNEVIKAQVASNEKYEEQLKAELALLERQEEKLENAQKYEGFGAAVANTNSLTQGIEGLKKLQSDISDDNTLDWLEFSELYSEYPEMTQDMLNMVEGDWTKLGDSIGKIERQMAKDVVNTITANNKKIEEQNALIRETQNLLGGVEDEFFKVGTSEEEAVAALEKLDSDQLLAVAESLGVDTTDFEASLGYFEEETTGLAQSVDNWDTWGQSVNKVVAQVNQALIDFHSNLANLDNPDAKMKSISAFSSTGGAKAMKTAVLDTSKQIGEQTKERKELINELAKTYKKQGSAKVTIGVTVEGVTEDPLLNDIHNQVTSGSSSSSDDTADLELFYKWLKLIEKTEKEISDIEAKNTLWKTASEYNLSTLLLSQELDMLKDKEVVQEDLIKQQERWLQVEKARIQSSYSWAKFTSDGMLYWEDGLQISQDEYDDIQEYITQFESHYDNVTEITNTWNEYLSKVKEMYEEIDDLVEKSVANLDKVIDRAKKISETTFDTGLNAMQYTTVYMALESEMDLIQSTFSQANARRNEVIEELRNSNYNELGYIAFDGLENRYKITEAGLDAANKNTQLMKELSAIVSYDDSSAQMIENSRERFEAVAEQLSEAVNTYGEKIADIIETDMDTIHSYLEAIDRDIDDQNYEMEMNGWDSDAFDNILTLRKKKIGELNAALDGLDDTMSMFQKTWEDRYGKKVVRQLELYTDEQGRILYNEQKIRTTLTEGEATEFLKELEGYNKAVEESVDLTSELQEEIEDLKSEFEELRDGVIEGINEVKNALKSADDRELEDLRKKYDEMTSLDNEYYSNLEKRIQKRRDAREVEDESSDISQLQRRISLLQKNGGSYSSELSSLQQQLKESLQAQADDATDRELERIKEEQEERQEQRELEEKQLENLITFKDENGIYLDETRQTLAGGFASVIALLMSEYQAQGLSEEEQQEQIDGIKDNISKSISYGVNKTFGSMDSIDTMVETIVKGSTKINTASDNVIEGMNDDLSTFIDGVKMQDIIDDLEDVKELLKVQSYMDLMQQYSNAWWSAKNAGNDADMTWASEQNTAFRATLAKMGYQTDIDGDGITTILDKNGNEIGKILGNEYSTENQELVTLSKILEEVRSIGTSVTGSAATSTYNSATTKSTKTTTTGNVSSVDISSASTSVAKINNSALENQNTKDIVADNYRTSFDRIMETARYWWVQKNPGKNSETIAGNMDAATLFDALGWTVSNDGTIFSGDNTALSREFLINSANATTTSSTTSTTSAVSSSNNLTVGNDTLEEQSTKDIIADYYRTSFDQIMSAGRYWLCKNYPDYNITNAGNVDVKRLFKLLGWTVARSGKILNSDDVVLSREFFTSEANKKLYKGYSKGGVVDYTGLAMVHGSTTSPEAFLNAKQTELFAQLRDSLVKTNNLSSFTSSKDNAEEISIGNIEISVKELAEIQDINKFVNTVKQSIYKDATSGGNLKLNRR